MRFCDGKRKDEFLEGWNIPKDLDHGVEKTVVVFRLIFKSKDLD